MRADEANRLAEADRVVEDDRVVLDAGLGEVAAEPLTNRTTSLLYTLVAALPLRWLQRHREGATVTVFALLTLALSHRSSIVIDSRHELNLDATGLFSHFANAWDPTTGLGHDNSWNVAYVFPFGIAYWLGEGLLGTSLAQAMISSAVLTAGFGGTLRLLRTQTSARPPLRILLATLVVINPYTITTLTDGYTVLLLPLVGLPWQVMALRQLVVERTRTLRDSLVLALSCLLMGGVNPPLSTINALVLLGWLVHLRSEIRFDRGLLARIGVAVPVTLLVNAFWLVGSALYFSSASDNSLQAILSESLRVQNSRSSYLNAVRGVALWSLNGSNAGVPYYRYGAVYIGNLGLAFFEFAIPVIALLGLLMNRRAGRRLLPLLGLLVMAVVMIVATHEGPFASLYSWAYRAVPGFAMFRSSYKFTSVYYFVISFVLASVLTSSSRLGGPNRRALVAVLGMAVTVLSFPYWTRVDINPDNEVAAVPAAYQQVAKFLSAQAGDEKVLLLPDQYFARYTWGQTKGNAEVLWGRDLVVRQPGDPHEIGNARAIAVTSAVLHRSPNARKLLEQLDVEYIVSRDDYDWQYYSDISQPPDVVRAALSSYKPVAEYGALRVYRTGVSKGAVRVSDPTVGLSYTRESSSQYRVHLTGLNRPTTLTLTQSFHPGWRVSLVGPRSSDVAPLIHGMGLGYANTWSMSTDAITTLRRLAVDGSVTLVIKFAPQRTVNLGLWVSAISTAGLVVAVTLAGLLRRPRRRRPDHD